MKDNRKYIMMSLSTSIWSHCFVDIEVNLGSVYWGNYVIKLNVITLYNLRNSVLGPRCIVVFFLINALSRLLSRCCARASFFQRDCWPTFCGLAISETFRFPGRNCYFCCIVFRSSTIRVNQIRVLTVGDVNIHAVILRTFTVDVHKVSLANIVKSYEMVSDVTIRNSGITS